MYKELRKQIADRKIIHATRLAIEERMQYKINTFLGLKGMSFKEVKIQMQSVKDDKFTKVFADLEDLDKQRVDLLKEEQIIDNLLESIDSSIKDFDEMEHKVFRGMYIWGKTQQEIANIEGYSLGRIKQISQDINDKMKK